MINFNFFLSWPWTKRDYSQSKDYFYKYWSVSKNKTLELQISKGSGMFTIVGVGFYWCANCDHAGVSADVHLLNRFIHLSFHDNRHWNDKENRYVDYNNPEEVEEYL